MTAQRLTPFDMVFAEMADERFPAILDAFDKGEPEVTDRDAFLMNRAAASMVHDLRPDEGLGPGVDHLAALVHHAYLHWRHGRWVFRAGRKEIIRILEGAPDRMAERHPSVYYLQVPHGLLWGQLGESEPHQPLDGCFVAWGTGDQVRTLGVFGLHPDRMGFAVVEAAGPLDQVETRPAKPAPFAPAMDGGQEAGLYSVNHPGELLLLALLAAQRVTQAFTAAPENGPHDVEIP